MSLRQIAKQLGVSHTLLVLWLQGKRTLVPELEARYHQLVSTGYTGGYKEVSTAPQSVSDRGPLPNGGQLGGNTAYDPFGLQVFDGSLFHPQQGAQNILDRGLTSCRSAKPRPDFSSIFFGIYC